jgi:hypothetical protein
MCKRAREKKRDRKEKEQQLFERLTVVVLAARLPVDPETEPG